MATRIPNVITVYGDVADLREGKLVTLQQKIAALGREVKVVARIEDVILNRDIGDGLRGHVVPIKLLSVDGRAEGTLNVGGRLFCALNEALLFCSRKKDKIGVSFVADEIVGVTQTVPSLRASAALALLGLLAVGGLAVYLSTNQSEANHDSWLASSITTVKNFLSSDEAQTALAVASYIV